MVAFFAISENALVVSATAACELTAARRGLANSRVKRSGTGPKVWHTPVLQRIFLRAPWGAPMNKGHLLSRKWWPLDLTLAWVVIRDASRASDICLSGQFLKSIKRDSQGRPEAGEVSSAWERLRAAISDEYIKARCVVGQRRASGEARYIEPAEAEHLQLRVGTSQVITGTLVLKKEPLELYLVSEFDPQCCWRSVTVNRRECTEHFSASRPRTRGHAEAIWQAAEIKYPKGIPNSLRWPAIANELIPIMRENNLIAANESPHPKTFSRHLAAYPRIAKKSDK